MHGFKVAAMLMVALLFTFGAVRSQDVKIQVFEVASVRPDGVRGLNERGSADGVRSGGPGTSDPGQMTISAMPLQMIIANAFDLSYSQISGPNWMIGERYTIRAKIPPMTTEEGAKEMLRNLLVERMGLAFHFQSRMVSGYELRVARGGPRLKGSEPATIAEVRQVGALVTLGSDGFPVLPPGIHSAMREVNGHIRFRFTNAPLSELAEGLAGFLGTEIIRSEPDKNGRYQSRILPAVILDKTGLMGRYDFTFEYEGSKFFSIQNVPEIEAKIRSALERQIGLTVVEAKVPQAVLVIDSARKLPEDN